MRNTAHVLACQRALKKGPKTLEQLAQASGATYQVISTHVIELRRLGEAHISGWAPGADGRPVVMVISAGPGLDAPRPPAKSAAERMAATRARRAGR